ncbi:TIGR02453 family protein [Gemmatimonas groenlandica]|uniref:TIGR02453 family protein n=1 Tax=Gemmatimonas groenlandica TaxID=2732249 RepID=A0A6M4IWI8_9BACT|nr:TIGR02453 family protein [Gemmatimonas groenlandica]QJR37926.1 TIGR02453 family protein [Gemmatimonas groenlandica]
MPTRSKAVAPRPDAPTPLPPRSVPLDVAELSFAGFTSAGLQMIHEVATRQDKAWVAEHKSEYETQVRVPLAALVVATMEYCAAAGLPLQGDPKRSLFRIHRDVRFSADKRPFHSHASAVLTRTAEKQSPGVLYLQIAPKSSFAAVGFYLPDKVQLSALREGIASDPLGWSRMVRALKSAELVLDESDALVRGPRGYEHAPEVVRDALRLRSLIIIRPLRAAELRSRKLPERLSAFALAAAPLLQFGWHALQRDRPYAALLARAARGPER